MKKTVILSLTLIIFLFLTCACSKEKEDNQFFGKWEAYEQTSDKGGIIKFGKYEESDNLKLTITFEENSYIIHYYVNGKEGTKYPQKGTYTFNGTTAKLSNNMVAVVNDDKLTIMYNDEDKSVIQSYLRTN